MEVLKESLEPFLMDTEIRWNPPRGYTVVDSTPKSLGTAYCHRTHLAFAFLKKTTSDNGRSVSSPPAMISGRLGGQGGTEVKVPIHEAVLPPLTPLQTAELASVLARVGAWSKLDELEVARLLAVSRKNSMEEAEEEELSACEPRPKRPRLNGEAAASNGSHAHNHAHNHPPPAELQKQLVRLSLEAGIPCPFTFYKGALPTEHEGGAVQALPYKHASSLAHVGHQNGGKNGVVSQRYQNMMRRRRHHHHHHHPHKNRSSTTEPPQGESIAATIAKSTFSAVSSTLMNFVNLFHPEAVSERDEGKTIEDEMEMGKRKGTQLYWDEQRGEIKYPSMYFKPSKSSSPSQSVDANRHHHHHHHHHHRSKAKQTAVAASGGGGGAPQNHAHTNGHHHHHHYRSPRGQAATPYRHASSSSNQQNNSNAMDTSSSSDDEEDVTISDSESDSSVELDWQSLPKTREYLPMIQMQLFNGAWPMVHEFSYAVRVPLGEIGRLPLLGDPKGPSQQKTTPVLPRPPPPPPHRNSTQDLDEEVAAHFWTTALAVTCFRECFPQFESEWELIVSKGEAWLEQHLDQCALGKEEVQSMAKELLFRKV